MEAKRTVFPAARSGLQGGLRTAQDAEMALTAEDVKKMKVQVRITC